MTKIIENKQQMDDFLQQFAPIAKSSNLDDIVSELQDKDDQYFRESVLVIQVSKVESGDMEVHVKDLQINNNLVQIELLYTYVGTHLRKISEPTIHFTVIRVPKDSINNREVVVNEIFTNYFIDEEITGRKVHTYYMEPELEKEHKFWHIQDEQQLSSVMNQIHDNYSDQSKMYGGIEESIKQIDLNTQDMVMALIVQSQGLSKNFPVIKAYEVQMDDLIDIEVGLQEATENNIEDTVGIVLMSVDKISEKQEVVVDFR